MKSRLHSFFSVIAMASAVALPAWSQTPVISSGGVANGATSSGSNPIAPGSLISIFGTDLASSPALSDTIPLSTTINKVSVTITGVPAPLAYVSPTEISAQVPWNADPGKNSGSVNVVVKSGDASTTEAVSLGQYSPGVFQYLNHAIAIIVTDSSDPRYGLIAAPPGSIPNLTTARAVPGDVIMIYTTGLGAVTPAVNNGANSMDQTRHVNVPPVVRIGGVVAELKSATLSPQFPGIYQVNVQVPSIPPDDAAPLEMVLGGITTSASVTIAVGQ